MSSTSVAMMSLAIGGFIMVLTLATRERLRRIGKPIGLSSIVIPVVYLLLAIYHLKNIPEKDYALIFGAAVSCIGCATGIWLSSSTEIYFDVKSGRFVRSLSIRWVLLIVAAIWLRSLTVIITFRFSAMDWLRETIVYGVFVLTGSIFLANALVAIKFVQRVKLESKLLGHPELCSAGRNDVTGGTD